MQQLVMGARAAGAAWAAVPLRARLAVIRAARRDLARRAASVAGSVGRADLATTLVAELLPLLEAARFLEREAPRLLATRRLGRAGRPLWLAGVRAEIRRDPCGAVLILAPGNYPLFLPGAQALQALAAGNAVCVKPAPGGGAPMAMLADALAGAGLPAGVLTVLDAAAGAASSAAGFDRIVLTGSAATGRAVLAAAADRLTPATMELSGSDAVFVLDGADLALVADALAYGLRLNGGATCIAPRRVFVPRPLAARLETLLLERVAALPEADVPQPTGARLAELLAESGARVHGVAGPRMRPVVAADVPERAALLREDLFAPWLALVPVADTQAALRADALCPFALGASVFGPEAAALALAARVRAGSVSVNDLIVPTADPRLPFGGRGESGFGVTRGAEGLLEMTVLRCVSVRRGRFRPHLRPPEPADAARFASMIGLLHGGPRGGASAVAQLVRTRKGRGQAPPSRSPDPS